MTRKIIQLLCLLSFSLLAAVVISQGDTYATVRGTLLDKAAAAGVYKCYTEGFVTPNIVSNNVKKIGDFVKDNSETFVLLPNDYTEVDDDDVSCYQLIGGYDGLGGKWPALSTFPSDASKKEEYFVSLGYTKGDASVEGGMCVVYYYLEEMTMYGLFIPSDPSTYAASTHYLCSDSLSEAYVSGKNSEGKDIINGKINVDKMSKDTSIGDEDLVQFELNTGNVQLDCDTEFLVGWGYGGCEQHNFTKGSTMWEDYIADIARDLAEHATPQTKVIPGVDYGPTIVRTLTFATDQRQEKVYDQITTDDLTRQFSLKSPSTDSVKATKTLLGFNNRPAYSLTKTERFFLYQDYLRNFYKAQVVCDPEGDAVEIAAQTGGHEQVYLYNVEKGEFSSNCWAKATQNANKQVNGVKDGIDTTYQAGNETITRTSYYFAQKRSFSDLISALNDSQDVTVMPDSYAEELQAFIRPGEDATTGDGGEAAETEPSCASRAGELGWILCPLIKGAGDLLQGFFENWIEPFLQIDAELLSGTNNGIFQAWQGFQTIANLVFVIIFLFVIFSQLTGVGIDNYGIKKVLPKLIIGAVLINLSYIICQLAVDVSNILGHAMKGFFNNIPPSVGGVQIRVNGGESTGALEAGAFVLTAIVGALVVQKVLTMGIMVIIPILIMLLTLLFSLFFLFFMLGVRQALAITLVAVSPLAFVCYILPNTKSLFKKWTDLFKAMLLAYPIASALVWGGDLVSRILINANAAAGTPGVVESLGLLVTAAIVSIAPVFAIPGLLKKSISAIDGAGGILGKIQSGGRSGAKRVGEGVQNSRVGNHMQNWQNSRNKKREDDRSLRRAGLQRNEDGTIGLSERGRRQNERAARLGDGVRGRAYRQRLADTRNAAFSGYNSDMAAARVATNAGAMATLAGLTNKQQQQEIGDEIINMAKDTGNYDLTSMEQQFAGLVSRDPDSLSADEKLRMKALVTKMSETGFGAKSVANILSGGYMQRVQDEDGTTRMVRVVTNSKAREQLADYMTSTDVANKVGGKDMYVAQYMRDIAAGNATIREGDRAGETMTFDEWAVDTSSHTTRGADGQEHGVSNVEFVAKKILDDDELLAKQGNSSLERTIAVDTGEYTAVAIVDENGNRQVISARPQMGGLAVSKERAQKIIDNENIHTKEEQEIVLRRRSGDGNYSNGQTA